MITSRWVAGKLLPLSKIVIVTVRLKQPLTGKTSVLKTVDAKRFNHWSHRENLKTTHTTRIQPQIPLRKFKDCKYDKDWPRIQYRESLKTFDTKRFINRFTRERRVLKTVVTTRFNHGSHNVNRFWNTVLNDHLSEQYSTYDRIRPVKTALPKR